MAVGIMTSGGDCPGLNAVIRAVTLKATRVHGERVIGFRNGWRGVLEQDAFEIERHHIMGIAKTGGTILGTSRTNPLTDDPSGRTVADSLAAFGVDSLIVVGGEGTLAGANELAGLGINIVGVPKTIDNDVSATDYTFGFDTAVGIATEAFDRLRTTGDSHGRAMVAEVMGHHAGWIALHSGMAAGAHAILIPEQSTTWDQLMRWVESARDRGRAPLVVVSEGFIPEGGTEVYAHRGDDASGRPRLGGIGEIVAQEIESRTGIEARATVLGHIQRGGTPSAFDRVLATRFGLAAIDAAVERRFGEMVALHGTDIVRVPITEAIGRLNAVPDARYEEAAVLFG